MGAVAFVLIGIGADSYRIPWEVWRSLPERHRYMDRESAASYKLEEKNGILLFLNACVGEKKADEA